MRKKIQMQMEREGGNLKQRFNLKIPVINQNQMILHKMWQIQNLLNKTISILQDNVNLSSIKAKRWYGHTGT